MKTIAEIHVANLEALVEPFGSQRRFAIHLGKDPKQVNQWWGKGSARGIGPQVAREIEAHFGKPRGWLDNDQSHLERLATPIIVRAVQLMREATHKVEGQAVNVESDPTLFAELLQLAIIEDREKANGERRDGAADGPGVRTAGAAGKAKIGDAARPAADRARRRAAG